MENAGYEVTTSPYLATSLSSALGGNYDLMTLDINMPGISGVEVAKVYKAKEVKTPIVIVSVWVDETKDEFIEAGIRHFFSKPFTAEGLLDAVRDAIGDDE